MSPYALCFAAGFVFAIAAAGYFVGSVKRLRRAVRFLTIVADAIDGSRTVTLTGRPTIVNPIEAELVSALKNQGAKKADAIALARAAIAERPTAEFVELFKLAASRKAVAA